MMDDGGGGGMARERAGGRAGERAEFVKLEEESE